MKLLGPIRSFDGAERFLSNFHPARVFHDGITYPSVENAYQAAKTHDVAERRLIAGMTAGAAKRHGQRVALRQEWEGVKVGVMYALVLDKFTRHPGLGAQLLQTGHRDLIEGNTWGDHFWGVCKGRGENHLGKILMEVRDHLRRLIAAARPPDNSPWRNSSLPDA